MNLDDLIVTDSPAPLASLSESPSPDLATQTRTKPKLFTNPVPINPHNKPRQISLPHAEFGYLARHHRNASIDESRVRFLPSSLSCRVPCGG